MGRSDTKSSKDTIDAVKKQLRNMRPVEISLMISPCCVLSINEYEIQPSN